MGRRDPRNSTFESLVEIPGMRRAVKQWQWHCIFMAVIFNSRVDGRHGASIGDDMGLGKVSYGSLTNELSKLTLSVSDVGSDWCCHFSPSALSEMGRNPTKMGSSKWRIPFLAHQPDFADAESVLWQRNRE